MFISILVLNLNHLIILIVVSIVIITKIVSINNPYQTPLPHNSTQKPHVQQEHNYLSYNLKYIVNLQKS